MMVQSETQGGTGFIVSETKVLTAAHLVGDEARVLVIFPGSGTRTSGPVTATDSRLDLRSSRSMGSRAEVVA